MQTLETINVGQEPNDGKGEDHRSAFQKINTNSQRIAAGVEAVEQSVQGAIPQSQKGAAEGVATLGADSRLSAAQIPNAQLLPTSAHDLNTYTTSGPFYQGAAAAATLANNYPAASITGFLLVETFGAATLQQFSTRSAPYRSFWRIKTGATTWSVWIESVDSSTALTYQGGIAAGQDLNNYLQRGMWIIGSSATAAGGTNFPIGQSGSLFVYSAGYPGGTTANSCTQVYNAANSNRQFFRSLVSGVWSSWDEVVRSSLVGAVNGMGSLDANGRQPVGQAPYSAILPAGTDANTLATPGVWHINSDAQATVALNWPVVLAGTLNVEAVLSGNQQVTQVYTTRNGTGGVIRRFVRVRFGTSSTWGTWQEIAVLDAATGRLPSTRLPAVTESLWNGATLTLGANGRWIQGNFDGAHAADTASVQTLRSNMPTYLPIVPGSGGNGAYVICRSAANANSKFVALGFNNANDSAEITFSYHGTSTQPQSLRFIAAGGEVGRTSLYGNWNFGPYGAPEIEARMYVRFVGGGNQHGIMFRPTTFADTVILNFLQANGVGSGSITMSTAGTTFYNTSSDYRLKEATGDVDVYGSLDRVMRTRLREFTWKMDGSADRGAFAHELAEIFPKAVSGEKDALTQDGNVQPQGVDWSKLVPDLIGAIQAQQAIIDELTRRVNRLAGESAQVAQE